MHRWFLFATLLLREKTVLIKLIIFLLQGLHPLLMWAMLLTVGWEWVTAAHGITGINLGIIAACLLIRHAASVTFSRPLPLISVQILFFRCYLN